MTQDSLDPIVPADTITRVPGIKVKAPAGSDSVYLQKKDTAQCQYKFQTR